MAIGVTMTDVQKQCLLKYLGFYEGNVDGIWGEKSRQATRAFQLQQALDADGIFGLDTESEILKAIIKPQTAYAARYFSREEFACKCGKYCNGYPAEMKQTAVMLADRARDHFGAPATVVSGLRCRQHNQDVGGVENSKHMTGEAIDLRIAGVSAEKLLTFLQQQPELRYAYAINETNVHLDVPRGSP